MGINGLWKILEPAQELHTLEELAIVEGYQRNARNFHSLLVGIDISILMDECTAAVNAAGLHSQFHGGPLRIFFHKLCRYLKMPATFVFVFDGSGRPAIKRGHKVNTTKPPWWTEPCRSLIKAFGFYSHNAPGEAEAELALLNTQGLIDVIITTDSDAFVFGAQCVLKSLGTKSNEHAVYSTHAIQNVDNVSLTLGGLLLIALLSGGDYSNGIAGCGYLTAYGLAKCGFGDQLLTAVNSLGPSPEDLKMYLESWRREIRIELAQNTQGFLTSCRTQLASSIPNTFPDLDLVNLYVNPLTSWSPSRTPPNPAMWIPQEPVIHEISLCCTRLLGWNNGDELSERFFKNLWEGVFLRMLFSPLVLYDLSRKRLATPSAYVTMIKLEHKKRRGAAATLLRQPVWFRATVCVKNFSALIGCKFENDSNNLLKVWIEDGFLPSAVPREMIKQKPSRPHAPRQQVNAAAGPSTIQPIPEHKGKFTATGLTQPTEVIELSDSSLDESILPQVIELTDSSESEEDSREFIVISD